MTTPEFEAIRYFGLVKLNHMRMSGILTGQSSAASFPTGPVMALPFISPLGFTICVPCQLLSHCVSPSSSRICTHHTSVVLEVQKHAVRSPPRLALAHHNSGHDLLPELRLALLHSCHHHISHACRGKPVQARTEALDGYDVEVAGAGVVAAVHDCAAVPRVHQYGIFPLASTQVFATEEGRKRQKEHTQADRASSSTCSRKSLFCSQMISTHTTVTARFSSTA